jgi:tight adherence protein C
VIVPLLAGASVGLGVLVLLRAAFPPRPALGAVLSRLHQPASVLPTSTAASAAGLPSARRLGRGVERALEAAGLDLSGLRRDLRVVGRPIERHMADKVLVGLCGVFVAPAVATLAGLGGVDVAMLVPAWAALLLGTAGFFVPDLTLRSEAAQRRVAFRYALGSFFDLVVISLAGGGGVETALHDSAQAGRGWAYRELQRALAAARVNRETPWAALGRLGEELGVGELCELAASVGLAGTEGARVRESLVAKASSLRAHELSEAESAAQSASERMSLPVVLLFVGFLVFLGYPAVDRILTGM